MGNLRALARWGSSVSGAYRGPSLIRDRWKERGARTLVDGTTFALEDELIATGQSPFKTGGVAVSGNREEHAVVAFLGGGQGDPILHTPR